MWKIRTIVGESRRACRELPLDAFDLVYVDGSHRAADVLEDAVLSFPLLKSGGIMIFDDYEWPGCEGFEELDRPRMGIDAFLACNAESLTVLMKGLEVAVRKR